MGRARGVVILLAVILLFVPDTVAGIPAFAHKYGVSCQLCHAPVPRLTPYGEQFAANGFEIVVGEPPGDTIDTGDRLLRLLRRIEIAVRMELTDGYHSVSGGVHYLMHRNVRIMTEALRPEPGADARDTRRHARFLT